MIVLPPQTNKGGAAGVVTAPGTMANAAANGYR